MITENMKRSENNGNNNKIEKKNKNINNRTSLTEDA